MLLETHPWIPLVMVVILLGILVGTSIIKGYKGEIPTNLKNPDFDKRRADVGSTETRIMPRD